MRSRPHEHGSGGFLPSCRNTLSGLERIDESCSHSTERANSIKPHPNTQTILTFPVWLQYLEAIQWIRTIRILDCPA